MKILSRICMPLVAALAAWMLPFGLDASVAASPSATAPETATLPADAEPAARPALWKVADEDTKIYIFGTVHVLPAGIDWFGGKVEQAFDSSQLLVTEITGGDPLAMMALVMDKAMLPGEGTLRDMLNDQEREAYEAALAELGIPLTTFDRFKPWYAAIGLSTLPLLREGFAGENGVEEFLHARAQHKGIAQEALETAEFQLGVFDSLPIEVQKNYLSSVISELPRIGKTLSAMIAAWKAGDADGLAGLINANETDPVLHDRLLISRNRTWAQWIGERLEQPGTVFLAVGAGHLAGSGSLQDQLAAAGIVSKRLQ